MESEVQRAAIPLEQVVEKMGSVMSNSKIVLAVAAGGGSDTSVTEWTPTSEIENVDFLSPKRQPAFRFEDGDRARFNRLLG